MTKTVHVIPHSHWDREWYFTTSRSKVYLLKDLAEVIRNLESNKGYDRFILDGQASLIEDYLKWKPEDTDRVKQLVQDKKLIIGPWYTQTDQFVISGESIVRNLQIGMDVCKQFGSYMNVGYVPDSFGQESSMPEIYSGFNIKDTMFWRGVSDEEIKHTEYKWKGEDGSEVNVYQIPSGYYIGGIVDETKLDQIMYTEPFKSIVERSTTSNIAFPNGFDQAPVRKDLPDLIENLNKKNKEFNFKLSSIEEYIDSVKEENPQLEKITGELTNGKNMRIHKSIYSSRSDLKKMNTQLQYYLVNVLEPVLTMGESYGIDYPRAAVVDIWKLMFENAAHDSIGSCVSDTTNEDIYMRYKQVRDISTNLVEVTLRLISVKINNNTNKPITLTLFNTISQKRSGFAKVSLYSPTKDFSLKDEQGNKLAFTIESCEDQTEYILNQTIQLNPGIQIYKPDKVYKVILYVNTEDIPALGYKQFTLDSDSQNNLPFTKSIDDVLENEFFKIKINSDGTLDIYDKESGIKYKKQAILEENGDGGDSFNYSPAKVDMILYSTEQSNSYSIKRSDLISMATIDFDFKVPKTLEDRANKVLNAVMPVSLKILLEKNSKVIKFKVEVDNREPNDHRLCIDFDSGIKSKVSIADQQFGTIKRPVYRKKEMELWESNKKNWNEKPISIETCQSFVALSNDKRSIAVFPQGVREYEIIGEEYSTIRLTLFRTYGWMGKEDLVYRPGRASGEKVIATPAAELHQIMTFSFALDIENNTFDKTNINSNAKEYDTDIQFYEYADFLNGRLIFNMDDTQAMLPNSNSLLQTDGKLILSSLKKANHRSGYVIRLYNAKSEGSLDDVITFHKKPSRVEFVDLKEETINYLRLEGKKCYLKNIGHAKFISIYFEY
jgi:mannosylglycerate hydrolase